MENVIVKPDERYGRLITTGIEEKRISHGRAIRFVEVVCDCGRRKFVHLNDLRQSKIKSCGCRQRMKHGESRTALYKVHSGIIGRCTNPDNGQWRNYGGRGITVCESWRAFPPFGVWALSNGYKPGLSIDRIDNEKGYSPDNCRWTNQKEQMRNTRRCLKVSAFGEVKTVAAWVDDSRCLVSKACLLFRIHLGVDHERALTTPMSRQNRFDDNRKSQSWRRCFKCGRYIGLETFQNGNTEAGDPTGIGDLEPMDPIHAHKICPPWGKRRKEGGFA